MKSKLLLDICVAVCWSNAIIDVCEIGIFYSACIQYIETIRNYCGLESAHNVRKETNRTDPASNCFLCEREKKRSRTNTKMKINNFARENVLRVDVKQQKNTRTHAKMATTTKSYTIYIDWSPHCNLIYIVNTWHCSLFLHSFIPPKKKSHHIWTQRKKDTSRFLQFVSLYDIDRQSLFMCLFLCDVLPFDRMPFPILVDVFFCFTGLVSIKCLFK